MDVFADYQKTVDAFLGADTFVKAYGNDGLVFGRAVSVWSLNRYFNRKVFKAKGCSYTIACEEAGGHRYHSNIYQVHINHNRTKHRLGSNDQSFKHRVLLFYITVAIPCDDGTSVHVIKTYDIPMSRHTHQYPFSEESTIKLVTAAAEQIIEHDVLANRWFTVTGQSAKTLLEARKISNNLIYRSGMDGQYSCKMFGTDRPTYFPTMTWKRRDGKNQHESFTFERRKTNHRLTCRASTRVKGINWCIEHHGQYPTDSTGQLTATESRQASKLYRPLVVGSAVYMISGTQPEGLRYTTGWDVNVLRFLIEHNMEFTRYKGGICVLSPEMATVVRVVTGWAIEEYVVGKRPAKK